MEEVIIYAIWGQSILSHRFLSDFRETKDSSQVFKGFSFCHKNVTHYFLLKYQILQPKKLTPQHMIFQPPLQTYNKQTGNNNINKSNSNTGVTSSRKIKHLC